MDKLNQLQGLLDTAKADGEKFNSNGNKAAGTRLRVTLQKMKVLATEIRKDVSEAKNS